MNVTHVRAGQVYRAPSHRGWRYVRILQVRNLDSLPYALADEITADGKPARRPFAKLCRLPDPRTGTVAHITISLVPAERHPDRTRWDLGRPYELTNNGGAP